VNNKPSLTAIYTALACTILSLLTFGYLFNGEPNLIQVLPFAFKSADPSLFPHDFFVASASSFPSFYPYLLGKALAVFGIYKFHFIAYVLTRFAVLWLTFLLAFELFGKTEIAVLSCVLAAASPFCNMLTLLGEDPILKTAFFQTSLAAPMVLGALLLFLRKRYIAALLITAGIYYINGLAANFAAALLFAASLSGEDKKEKIRAWLCFAAAVAPAMIYYAGLKNIYGGESAQFMPLLRQWYAGHYFPHSWPAQRWERIITFALLLTAVFNFTLPLGKHEKTEKRFLLCFGALWLAAYLFSEILPCGKITVLQLFRSDSVFFLLAVIHCAAAVFLLLEKGDMKHAGAAALLILSLTEMTPPYYAAAAALGALTLAKFPERTFRIAGLAGAAASVLFLFTLPLKIKALSAAAIFGLMLAEKPLPRAKYILVCVLGLAQLSPLWLERMKTFDFQDTEPVLISWRQTQLWARDNTPKDSIFLTPPELNGFRVESRRTPVFEWIDAAAMHWAPGYETLWHKTLRATRAQYRQLEKSPDDYQRYALEPSGDFGNLIRRYAINYVIVFRSNVLPLPVVYQNGTFTVYDTASILKADRSKSP